MLLALLLVPAQPAAAEELPLPRFASLKADEVNLRAGPGRSYAVDWVLLREGMPVEIIAEHDQWRKIRDAEGTVGWVHRVMLSGRRTVLVQATGVVVATESPAADAIPVFRAEPGVVGNFLECRTGWCRIEAAGHTGWLPMRELWGVYPEDAPG